MSIIFKNLFRSSQVRGNFSVTYNPVDDIQPSAYLEGNVYLGKEIENQDGSFTNTDGSIIFRINNVEYTITRDILSYLVNISSDVQTQISGFSWVPTRLEDDITNNRMLIKSDVLNSEYRTTYDGTSELVLSGSDARQKLFFGSRIALFNDSQIVLNDDSMIGGLTSAKFTFLSDISGNVQSQLDTLTSDLNTYTTSNDTNISSLQTDVSNLQTDVSNNILNFSNYTPLSTYNTYTTSNDTNISNLQTNVSNLQTDVSNNILNFSNYTPLSTYNTYTSSNDTNITNIQAITNNFLMSGNDLLLTNDMVNNDKRVTYQSTSELVLTGADARQKLFFGSKIALFNDSEIVLNDTASIEGLDSTKFGYLSTVSSNVQTQIDSLDSRLTTVETNGGGGGGSSVLDSYITYDTPNTELDVTPKMNFADDIILGKYVTTTVENTDPNPTNYLRSLHTGGSTTTYNHGGHTIDDDIGFTHTISFHFKALNDFTNGAILYRSKSQNVRLRLISGTRYLEFLINYPAGGTSSHLMVINTDQWYFYTCTMEFVDAQTYPTFNAKIYLDAVEEKDLPNANSTYTFSFILCPINGSVNNVYITELLIHDRILSLSEIQSLRTTQITYPIVDNSVIYYFRFDSNDTTVENYGSGTKNLLLNTLTPFVTELPGYFTHIVPSLPVTSSDNNISFTYHDVSYNITPTNLYHLRDLTTDVQSALSIVSQNSLNIVENAEKLQYIVGGANDTFFTKNITSQGPDANIVLGSDTNSNQLLFYTDSYINQIGNNVTNYFKNLSIAAGSFINNMASEKLEYLKNITQDVQAAITSFTSSISSLQTDVTNLQTNQINNVILIYDSGWVDFFAATSHIINNTDISPVWNFFDTLGRPNFSNITLLLAPDGNTTDPVIFYPGDASGVVSDIIFSNSSTRMIIRSGNLHPSGPTYKIRVCIDGILSEIRVYKF